MGRNRAGYIITNVRHRNMHMKSNSSKIATAGIVTIIWLTSLCMIVFEKERFPFTPVIMFNVGLMFSFAIKEPKRKKITFKELLFFFLTLIGIVTLIIYVPLLREQPPQPYRSIMATVVVLPFIIWYLWWPIYKGNKKKKA